MVDQQRLGRVFVELADTLVTDFDVVEFMTMLAHRVVELLGAREAGVVLADERGLLRSVASTHESAHLLDLFELQNQEGPCLDCYRTGEAILNHSLAGADNPWPRFAEEARRLGFTTVHALPMRLRGEVIGAVNIFASNATPLTPSEIEVGQALADVATVGLLQERSIREARLLNEQLQSALNSRIVIEQAKGMLAERRGIEMDTAFDAIRAYARNTNQKLSAVAQSLLAGTLSAEVLDRH
jgi:transcriptional regulator with GAF, ATPase, and Fis domain